MNWWHPRSLKWQLVVRLAVMQAAMLGLLGVLVLVVLGAMWRSGVLGDDYEGTAIDVLTEAVGRNADGELVLRPTSDLARLRSENADLWFIVRDGQGHRLSEGIVPADLAQIANALDQIGEARLGQGRGEAVPPAAIVRWVDTAAGKVQMLTAAKGRVSVRKVIATAQPLFLNVVLPIIGLMTLATLLVTPFVVRRAMAGLGRAADEAKRIDIDRSGVRLTMDDVPIEVVSLVRAVNDALGRLDKGYEGHKRFLADAAHELRTPIAILTARVSSLPPGPEKIRLLEDTTRLTVLTGQLLDLQRLDQQGLQSAPVDLVGVAERVVLDLAPLAFAAGYEMTFEAEIEHVMVEGDQTALDRALTNLVQNAIDHGGRGGTITVRVARAGWIEVCDEGNGIPSTDHHQVFEPFYRLRQGGRGAGLGLDLVQKIMRLHGGHAEIVVGPSKGACLRMVFPWADAALNAGT
ncbi:MULTISPECIES: HAMP domain-containing sensor histidine kinase [unclassified Bradyrhizobium]|uniref:sensor histidine kinase n=1 Tax=unclassified Bradyrhizobium TaxID=2631580 RepID=UPI00291605DA|nr:MULTISPECIES: HAMP domain-containing sensor histidine kinase [unclassified Bradyrhizobium]